MWKYGPIWGLPEDVQPVSDKTEVQTPSPWLWASAIVGLVLFLDAVPSAFTDPAIALEAFLSPTSDFPLDAYHICKGNWECNNRQIQQDSTHCKFQQNPQ